MRGGASAAAVGNCREVTPSGPRPTHEAHDVSRPREPTPRVCGRSSAHAPIGSPLAKEAEGWVESGLTSGRPCWLALLLCHRPLGPWGPVAPLPATAGLAVARRLKGPSPRLPSSHPVAPPTLGWAAGSGAERSGVSIPTTFAGRLFPALFPARSSPHCRDREEGRARVGGKQPSPEQKAGEAGLPPVKCRPGALEPVRGASRWRVWIALLGHHGDLTLDLGSYRPVFKACTETEILCLVTLKQRI